MKRVNKENSKHKIKYSVYSTVMIMSLLSVLILLNYLVNIIDERFNLSVDMTSSRLYSLTSTTESILEGLEEDIFIYTTETADIKDYNVAELLKNYSSASNKVHLINIDILKNPAAIEYYNELSGNEVMVGSVIISNSPDTNKKNQKYSIVNYEDMYTYNAESEAYDEFNAENAITGAIKKVADSHSSKIWILDNHNTDLMAVETIREILEYENYQVEMLNILNGQNPLSETDIVLSISIENDLTAIERDILNDFLDKGGRMIIALNPQVYLTKDLDNYLSLIYRYSIKTEQGIIKETDLGNIAVTGDGEYMFSFILPQIAEHEITSEFVTGNYKMLLGMNSGGLILPDKINDANVKIEPVLYTSESSYLEQWNADTDDKAESNVKYGEFIVMTAVTEIDDIRNTKIIVTSAPEVFTYIDAYIQDVYKNKEMLLKCISWLSDEEDGLIIPGKLLNGSPLMIETMKQARLIIILVCVVIPLLIFGTGIFIFIERNNL